MGRRKLLTCESIYDEFMDPSKCHGVCKHVANTELRSMMYPTVLTVCGFLPAPGSGRHQLYQEESEGERGTEGQGKG